MSVTSINKIAKPEFNRQDLIAYYQQVRNLSEEICLPLCVDDYQIQSRIETSPPKWHLAHVTWFFETFVLSNYISGYQSCDKKYNFLFNSYYLTVGNMYNRAKRGFLSRPTVEEIYQYRFDIDTQLIKLLAEIDDSQWQALSDLLILGLNHEQQHQELLFMDIKHNLWNNPLRPAYLDRPASEKVEVSTALEWEQRPQGLIKIGNSKSEFTFDNERPKHRVWLEPHKLGTRLITNAEYLDFMCDGGYERPELWLADGWSLLQEKHWKSPLYWEHSEGEWSEFTLYGMEALHLATPVSHVSYYEADAFARWAGKRLPLEAELETKLAEIPLHGQFSDSGVYHPQAGTGQYYGTLWEWTGSPYIAYPGYKPLPGSIGEYNGKFMCSQWVLRGGSCVTPENHIRASYRNFFYPHDRWQFAGIRLAENG